jgi:hypothetical protein
MKRLTVLFAALALLPVACDGKDPERLNRVGKKIVEKSRRLADDSDLPKVQVTMPEKEKTVVEQKSDKASATDVPSREK